MTGSTFIHDVLIHRWLAHLWGRAGVYLVHREWWPDDNEATFAVVDDFGNLVRVK